MAGDVLDHSVARIEKQRHCPAEVQQQRRGSEHRSSTFSLSSTAEAVQDSFGHRLRVWP